jgi:mitochondrial fission protein ELM1
VNCWIITEGLAGTENQCLGVAESLGITPVVKRVQLRQPWKLLSPWLGFEHAGIFSPALNPPWPDLLITSGRKAIAAARYIKKASGGKTLTVHIQDPRINPRSFDLLAVPAHDPARGDNVIVTLAAPNKITPEKLEAAKKQFSFFEKIRGPRVAVLIGGDSKAHALTPALMQKLADQLKNLNAGLMITTSRRTGVENERILKEALAGTDAWIWDGQGENPYFGLLAWADAILVTADSTSMLSDAGTTGKPVHMIPLEGGGRRIDSLHENLIEAGIVRRFEGRLERWNYKPLRDAEKIASAIKPLLAAKAGFGP